MPVECSLSFVVDIISVDSFIHLYVQCLGKRQTMTKKNKVISFHFNSEDVYSPFFSPSHAIVLVVCPFRKRFYTLLSHCLRLYCRHSAAVAFDCHCGIFLKGYMLLKLDFLLSDFVFASAADALYFATKMEYLGSITSSSLIPINAFTLCH